MTFRSPRLRENERALLDITRHFKDCKAREKGREKIEDSEEVELRRSSSSSSRRMGRMVVAGNREEEGLGREEGERR